jgi:ribosomal protein S18 acetylase RimI-like enzyme
MAVGRYGYMERERIRFFEKAANEGFKGLEIKQCDGWELRFSEGYTRRVNSVSVYEDGKLDVDEKIAFCENEYRSHGLPCIFKITDADRDLADNLLKRGYTIAAPTDLMILKLDEYQSDITEEVLKDVVFSAEPDAWYEPYFEFEGLKDAKNQELCKRINNSVTLDKLFVKVMYDGNTAAVASTATKEGYSLLHNVVVNESLRGIGLGEKLCRATIEKSKELGAQYLYLQVMQENKIALNLYKKIGFVKLYEYCYMKKDFK